jgi:hemerythrin-like domain-containing protein
LTKRHPSLIPLTHDHHHALAQARRLRIAATSSQAELLDRAGEFLAFFRAETIEHFREEEEIVFPLAVHDPRARELLGRVVTEHLEIHALIFRLAAEFSGRDVSAECALQVAQTLETHIRLEEGQVFPLLERVVSESELAEISLASRSRTEPPDADGGSS